MTFNEISDKQKIEFADELTKELAKYPFGGMPPRDLNCLLLYLFRKNGFVPTAVNEKTCDALCISQIKLRTFITEIRYKYNTNNQAEDVKSIIKDLSDGTIKLQYKNENFTFAIMDPTKYISFQSELEERGYFVDSSFNKNIVKINADAMFSFLSYGEDDAKHKNFLKKLKTTNAEHEKIIKAIDKTKSLKERFGETSAEIAKVAIPVAIDLAQCAIAIYAK